jgi:hypothetical protein
MGVVGGWLGYRQSVHRLGKQVAHIATDDDVIWCVTDNHVDLPGGVTITDPPQPIWARYSP